MAGEVILGGAQNRVKGISEVWIPDGEWSEKKISEHLRVVAGFMQKCRLFGKQDYSVIRDSEYVGG